MTLQHGEMNVTLITGDHVYFKREGVEGFITWEDLPEQLRVTLGTLEESIQQQIVSVIDRCKHVPLNAPESCIEVIPSKA